MIGRDEEWCRHVVEEFGPRGQRCVEFMRMAAALLESPEEASEARAACAAYCLREAMTAIARSDGMDGGTWREASRAVVEAKTRWEGARGLPGEDEHGLLQQLIVSIDELQRFHDGPDSRHQQGLDRAIKKRTGVGPLATEVLRNYQKLLDELNGRVHGTADASLVRMLAARCDDILAHLFQPPGSRLHRLTTLAESESAPDVEALQALAAGPRHLGHFLRHIRSPEWIARLETERLLDPSGADHPWPVLMAMDHLRANHPAALGAALEPIFQRRGSDPYSARQLAMAAWGLRSHGRSVVLEAARRHRELAEVAIWYACEADPEDDFVREVADVVLDRFIETGTGLHVEPLVTALKRGVTAANYQHRVRTLWYKVDQVRPETWDYQSWMMRHPGSLADLTSSSNAGTVRTRSRGGPEGSG